MTLSAEQNSIVGLLTRIYAELHDMEAQFHLQVGDHDFRPRIDYFHDAVRAFTSGEARHRERGGRLCVELLAYDLSCLRYLQSMPLASFKPHGQALAPGTGMVAVKAGLVPKAPRPDRAARERISELYQHYAVLFAALLKPFADRDYRDRIEELNQQVESLHAVKAQAEALGQGKGAPEGINAAIAHLEETDLRHELVNFMHKQHYKKKDALQKLVQFLKGHAARKDKEIAAIDAAHMNYAMAQLAIFEGSKDMLKTLAGQGMNLIGNFVQSAMAESRSEMGR